MARYAIGILYKHSGGVTLDHESSDAPVKDCLSTIAGLEPINFITVATPHLGSRGNRQVCISALFFCLQSNLVTQFR